MHDPRGRKREVKDYNIEQENFCSQSPTVLRHEDGQRLQKQQHHHDRYILSPALENSILSELI